MGSAKRTTKRTTKKPAKTTDKPQPAARTQRSPAVPEEDIELAGTKSGSREPERDPIALETPSSEDLRGLVRELIQELGEAKERAARAETKADFLTDLNAELRTRLEISEKRAREKVTPGSAASEGRSGASPGPKWRRRRAQAGKPKDPTDDFDLDSPPKPNLDLR